MKRKIPGDQIYLYLLCKTPHVLGGINQISHYFPSTPLSISLYACHAFMDWRTIFSLKVSKMYFPFRPSNSHTVDCRQRDSARGRVLTPKKLTPFLLLPRFYFTRWKNGRISGHKMYSYALPTATRDKEPEKQACHQDSRSVCFFLLKPVWKNKRAMAF